MYQGVRYVSFPVSENKLKDRIGIEKQQIKPFHPSLAFHIETSHLIFRANQITGLYMKWDPGLECVKSDPPYEFFGFAAKFIHYQKVRKFQNYSISQN